MTWEIDDPPLLIKDCEFPILSDGELEKSVRKALAKIGNNASTIFRLKGREFILTRGKFYAKDEWYELLLTQRPRKAAE